MKTKQLTSESFVAWHEDFTNYILTVGYGNGRPTSYAANVKEFLLFMESKQVWNLNEITQKHLLYYRQYLITRKHHLRQTPLADSTIKHHLISVRMFFDFLLDSKAILYVPGHLPSFHFSEVPPREIFTVDEINYLFRIARDIRDKLILCCAYGCGLRRNEIYLLNRTDIHLSQNYLRVNCGKGNKTRIVPIANSIAPYFRKYLTTQLENAEDPALLLNKNGNRLSYSQIYVQFVRLLKRAKKIEIKQKHLTLHSLRHSIAVHLMNNGAGIEFIKEFLGHQCIDTTQLYAIRRKRRIQIERAFR